MRYKRSLTVTWLWPSARVKAGTFVRRVLPAVPNSPDRRALTAGVLLLATTLLPRLAIADVKTIGPLSFAVPDGWKYETSAPDRADMVWQNSNGAYLIILLTAPRVSFRM